VNREQRLLVEHLRQRLVRRSWLGEHAHAHDETIDLRDAVTETLDTAGARRARETTETAPA
jgi:hypothetical protein